MIMRLLKAAALLWIGKKFLQRGENRSRRA